jgi:ketosteroid isomerase-like protein
MELWELSAREEIRDLVARYNANGDAGRFDEVVALFAPDAVMELPDRRYQGSDEIRRVFTDAAASFAAVDGFEYLRHFTATLQIDVERPDEARARCYYAVVMKHGLDHWGRYIDRFTVVDGHWRFAQRRVTVDGRHDTTG